MRNIFEKIVLSCLLASAPMLACAQATATPESETMAPEAGPVEADAAPVTEPLDGQILAQDENTLLAGDLIGLIVYSASGDAIGDINDIIITNDGTVEGLVIGVGGFLGMGEKDVAFEMDKLALVGSDADSQPMLVMNVMPADLEMAPAFKTAIELQREEEAKRLQQEAERGFAPQVN